MNATKKTARALITTAKQAGTSVPLEAVEEVLGLPLDRARQLVARLTDRQRETARLMAQGLSNRQIAERMGISPKTGDIHRADVFDKLETKTAAGVAAVVLLVELADAAR